MQLAGAYADLLDDKPDVLADLRASAAVHRDHHRFRLVVVAPDVPAARDALLSWLRGEPAAGLAGADADPPPSITVVRPDALDVDALLAELLPGGGYTVAATALPSSDTVITCGANEI